MTNSETKKVDDFCAAINASHGLDLRARSEALKAVFLPEGFHTVVLRYPDTGAFAGYWSSTGRSGSMMASRLCGWLSRSGHSSVRSAASHEPEERTVNLVLCQ
jgi:hypothetical protein